ncbi:hypothetical protein L1049_001151 [Liquidambar formosana]|uniref:Uncharacterized protein n=1 Tax=Liquidambar formosana TaxID=63359 RepID=A0AAP0NDR6_LIQFO
MFKEAVGLSEKLEESGSESESESELKKRLRKLEREVRQLKANSKERDNPKRKEKKKGGASKSKGLHALFTGKNDEESLKEEEPMVFKELSPDVMVFVRHLYKEGYFNDANFLRGKAFDISCFHDSYGRDFIKFAAEKFGKDNQEIAKWLSGSDLKTVALFGCPTLSRKNIFSAKRLRTFFGIQEDTVCRKCCLKTFMQVCESERMERSQAFGFGRCNEGYHFVCFGGRASTAHSAR